MPATAPFPVRRPLTIAALAGSLVAVALGLGPSQPDNVAINNTINAINTQVGAMANELTQTHKELRDTREQVVALRDEVKGLTSDLAEIKRMLGTMARPASAPPPPPLILPKEPLASPDALLAVVRERYVRTFSEIVADNDTARRDRQRDIERWVRETNQELRGKTRWLVRVESLKESPAPEGERAENNTIATYTVLEAVSRRAISSTQTVRIPGYLAARMRGHPDGTLAEVGVLMSADLVYDPARADTGIFGVPALIGPYVLEGLKVEWSSIEPIRDSAKPERHNPDPGR